MAVRDCFDMLHILDLTSRPSCFAHDRARPRGAGFLDCLSHYTVIGRGNLKFSLARKLEVTDTMAIYADSAVASESGPISLGAL